MRFEDLTSLLKRLASKLGSTAEVALGILGVAAAALPSALSSLDLVQTVVDMHSVVRDTRKALSWWWKQRNILKQIPAYIDNWEKMEEGRRKALQKALRAIFALDDEFARVILETTDIDDAIVRWLQSAGADEIVAGALRDLVQAEMHQLLLNNPELLDHLQYQGIMALRQAMLMLGDEMVQALNTLEQIRRLLEAELTDKISQRESLRHVVGLKTFREIVRDVPGKMAEPFRDGPPTMADFAAGFVVPPREMLGEVARALGIGVPTLGIEGPVVPDSRFAAVTLFGHSGSGKTYLALTLAYEMEQFGWDIFCLDLATFERPTDGYVILQRIADVVRERYLVSGTAATDDPPRVLLIVENIHLAPELASDSLSTFKRICGENQSGGLVRLLLIGRPPLEAHVRGSLIDPLDIVVEQSVRIDMEPFSEVTVANMISIVERRQSVRLSTRRLIHYSGGDNFLIVSALKAIDKDGSLDVLNDGTVLARHVWNFYLEHVEPINRTAAKSVLCVIAAFSSIEAPVLAGFVRDTLKEKITQVAVILNDLTDKGLLRMYQSQEDSSQIFIGFYHSRRAQIILATCKNTEARSLRSQYLESNPPDFVPFTTSLALWGAHTRDEELLVNLLSRIEERDDCFIPLWTIGVRLSETKPGLAAIAFRRVTSLKNDIPQAWYNLGVLLARQEQWEEAEVAYRTAIRLRDDLVDAWNNLGALLAKQRERWDEAEMAFHRALELRDDDAQLWNNLGVLLAKQRERWEEAEQAYRRAIELSPDDARVWNNLGALLVKQKRLDEAERSLRRAIDLESEYADAWYNLGVLLAEHAERWNEAEMAFRRAIELREEFAHAWYDLGVLLAEHTDRWDEAEDAFRRAIELREDFAEAWYNLGVLLMDKEDRWDEAEMAYRKAIGLKDDYAKAWNSLGNLLAKQKQRWSEAEMAYRTAIRLKPDDAEVWNNLGILLAKQDRSDEAEAAYHRAIELKPDYAKAWYNLGLLLEEQRERWDEAEKAYRKAINLKLDNPLVWINLGVLLAEREQWDEAERAFRRAIELGPGYAEAWYNLGNILVRQKRWSEAETAFREAIALRGDYVDAWNNLGLVLLEQGETQPAAKALFAAIRLRPSLAERYVLLSAYWRQRGSEENAEAVLRVVFGSTSDEQIGNREE